MDSQFSLVTFEAHVGPSHPDAHSVHVVGDHPALGCWDPAKSVPLFVSPECGSHQIRASVPVSVPTGVTLQYKYVVIAGGQLQRWEGVQGNRMLVPDCEDHVMRDELDRAAALPLPVAASVEPSLPPLPPTGMQTSHIAESTRSASDDGESESAVLVVSYILPLVIAKNAADDIADGAGVWNIAWNQDSITAKKRSLNVHARVQWIGCPGIVVAEEDRASLASALVEYNCVPLFLEAELEHSFYFGFCRSYLWPTFHNVIKARMFADKVWRAYCTANRIFADKVIEVYDSGDLVWVQPTPAAPEPASGCSRLLLISPHCYRLLLRCTTTTCCCCRATSCASCAPRASASSCTHRSPPPRSSAPSRYVPSRPRQSTALKGRQPLACRRRLSPRTHQHLHPALCTLRRCATSYCVAC